MVEDVVREAEKAAEQASADEEDLPLREIERGEAPDRLLQPNDVIYIPFSFAKNMVMGTSSIVAATTSALIYAH